MEKWELWLLIALVLGVIVSNLMVLKHTANMKLPPFFTRKKKQDLANPDHKNSEQKSTDDKSWGKQDWQSDDWDKDDWK